MDINGEQTAREQLWLPAVIAFDKIFISWISNGENQPGP